MTIVVVWIDPSNETLWCAADTRFSTAGNTGTIKHTDRASKILSLPVVCRTSSIEKPGALDIVSSNHWGLAFAGAVAPAMTTYAAATILLQNLQRSGGSDDPNPVGLADAARLLAELGGGFMRDYLSSSNGAYGRFEMALFGWCARAGGFRIAHLKPAEGLAPELAVFDCDPVAKRCPLVLGEPVRFMEAYDQQKQTEAELPRTAPLRALEAIVASDIGAVGGSVSIAAASKPGVSIYGRFRRIPGGAKASAFFYGIPLKDNLRVGNSFISIALIEDSAAR
jgi:hypothetical protein